MGQRMTRAKAKIKAAPFLIGCRPPRIPGARLWRTRRPLPRFQRRLSGDWAPPYPVRHELTAGAIRLTRLIRALMAEDGEAAGLLALMLLTVARRIAGFRRVANWSPSTSRIVGRGIRRWSPKGIGWCASAWLQGGSWPLSDPRGDPRGAHLRPQHTRHGLVAGRRSLRPVVRLDPSPIIALNRAVAVAELDGPEVALAAVNRLEDTLARYHAYHATRADLLRGLGRSQDRAWRTTRPSSWGATPRDRLPDAPPRPAGVVAFIACRWPPVSRRIRLKEMGGPSCRDLTWLQREQVAHAELGVDFGSPPSRRGTRTPGSASASQGLLRGVLPRVRQDEPAAMEQRRVVDRREA